jgi:hypothetical protein
MGHPSVRVCKCASLLVDLTLDAIAIIFRLTHEAFNLDRPSRLLHVSHANVLLRRLECLYACLIGSGRLHRKLKPTHPAWVFCFQR